MKKNTILLIIASALIFSQQINAQVNKQDSLALVDLYNSTDGPNWKTSKRWLSNERVEYWAGIQVTEDGKNVEEIALYGNYLKGTIPESIGNLSKLETLYLGGNNLTEIPSSIGNLAKLVVLHLESSNISGQIPAEIGNLENLAIIDLAYNDITGEIPTSIGNLINLAELKLSGNDLSGAIPSSFGNLTNIKEIDLCYNNISGSIPSFGNLTKIKSLRLDNNNISGSIPPFGNLTEIKYLNLSNNNIFGSIPSSIGKLKNLVQLYLKNNNITNIPIEINNCSRLVYLDLSNNNLNDLPAIILDLKKFTVDHNSLNYTSLEKQSSLNIFNDRYSFKFVPQKDTLDIQCKTVGDSIKFTFERPGGTKTEYEWLLKNTSGKYVTLNTTSNSIKISKQENNKVVDCFASNTLIKHLYFTGFPSECNFEETDCWQAGQLTFCVHSGKWKKGGTNKIKTTNIISINNFLFFDGTMTIDTTKLELEASGEFYVDNIPLAKDLGYGKYTLAEGKYKLNLIGDEQKITNFLNSELSKTAMIFGTPAKIDNLTFFNRNDTIGININASVSVPLLSTGCGIPGIYNPKTELKLKNFEITNKGILSAGFAVKNLGLFQFGCLKNATVEYDWKKDILIGGAELSLSIFGDIGAGIKLEDGKIDSIAWKIDSSLPPIPIYATFSAKGFYGHVAGLNNFDENNQFNSNNIDVKIGGIFTDIIAKQAYQLDIDGRIKMSGLLEGSGQMQFFQPPVPNFPYQIKGFGKVALNYSNKQMDCDFTGNFGTLNGEEWIGDAKGNFSFNMRNETPELSAYFYGDFTLPRISDQWPLNMISITVGTTNRIFNDHPNLVYGIVYEYLTTEAYIKIPYIIDITKEWWMWGYIRFPSVIREGIKIPDEKSGLITNIVTKTFTVPENNEFGVIEIKSKENPPTSSITSPSGKKHSASSSEDNIFYSESENKKDAFWSLLEAAPGDWTITLENPTDTDSLFTHFKLKEKEFKFSMNQTENTVTINWDVAQVEEGQTVNIMLDNDDAGFDGFRIKKGDAAAGQLSFSLDESTPDCYYYLFVQLIGEYSVIQSYADEVIKNPFTSLAPPLNFTSYYNTETGECEFNWDKDQAYDISGYILTITNNQDNDSIYAIINGYQNYISLFIDDFETKSAKIESFNEEWKIGCPSVLTKLTTGIEENYQILEEINNLKIYPNPTNGNLTIRYYVSEPSKCEIRIYNIDGQEIAQPLTGFQSTGFHQFDFQYENFPNGMYLIKYINSNQSVTVKSVLSK